MQKVKMSHLASLSTLFLLIVNKKSYAHAGYLIHLQLDIHKHILNMSALIIRSVRIYYKGYFYKTRTLYSIDLNASDDYNDYPLSVEIAILNLSVFLVALILRSLAVPFFL